ncbi:MAG: SPOR domain-containing protein [Bacteroidota bacterium]
MMRTLLLIGCFLCSGLLLQGQSGRTTPSGGDILIHLQDDQVSDKVSIQMDSLLVANYYKFRIRNRKDSGIPGYRIRIYSESGLGAKEEQQRIRAKFISYYPGIDAYHRYDEPYFKVYVGDCRTKSEALKLDDMIKKRFPNSIIVSDYINIKSNE